MSSQRRNPAAGGAARRASLLEFPGIDRTDRANGVYRRLKVARQAAAICAEPPPLPAPPPSDDAPSPQPAEADDALFIPNFRRARTPPGAAP